MENTNKKAYYKTFKSTREVVEFLNASSIKKEDILSINYSRERICLIYYK